MTAMIRGLSNDLVPRYILFWPRFPVQQSVEISLVIKVYLPGIRVYGAITLCKRNCIEGFVLCGSDCSSENFKILYNREDKTTWLFLDHVTRHGSNTMNLKLMAHLVSFQYCYSLI